MDKLPLVFAVLEHFAEKAGEQEVSYYLLHSSQHSAEFMDAVKVHHDRIDNFAEFAANHKRNTNPVGHAQTYSKEQLDAMVNESVNAALAEAKKEQGQTYTKAELDALIAESVKAALRAASKKKDGD